MFAAAQPARDRAKAAAGGGAAEEYLEEEEPSRSATGAVIGAPARAGEREVIPPPEVKPLEPIREPPPLPPSQPFVPPKEKYDDLVQRFLARRGWLEKTDLRRADEEMREIARIKADLGLENLFWMGAALVRESRRALAAGHAAEAVKACQLAAEVAPALPAAHLCLARATLAQDPLAVGAVAGALIDAAGTTLSDLRARNRLLADELLRIGLALWAAAALVVVLLFLRHARYAFHDFQHLFPKGATSLQTSVLLLLVLASPVLAGLGPLAFLALLTLVATLYFGGREPAAAIAAWLAIAAPPYAARLAADSVAFFGGPGEDVYALERGEGPQEVALRIAARSDAGQAKYGELFALAHWHKREGRLQKAEEIYRRAADLGPDRPEVQVNLGNVLFLLGNSGDAKAAYEKAIKLDPDRPEAHLNISHVYLQQSELSLVEKSQLRAMEIDRARVEPYTRLDPSEQKKLNRFLMDAPLDNSDIAAVHDGAAASGSAGVPGEVRRLVAGKLGVTLAAALPFAVLLLAPALRALRGRARPSSACTRCGRPVCGRCDPDLGNTEGLCGQCVSVFVRRTGVDQHQRENKEAGIRAFRTRRSVVLHLLAVLFPGGGHLYAGHALAGMVLLFVAALLASHVDLLTFVRSTSPIEAGSSLLRWVVLGTLALVTVVLSLWHLRTREKLSEA
jgi:tetratricopeptide (TPR) repeat protein